MRYLFLIFISLLLVFFSCKEEKKNEIKKITVKKIQNANKEALLVLNEFYSNSVGDSLLIINTDSLITYPFFDQIHKKDELVFTNNGKLTAIGDSIFSLIANARNFGLVSGDYHYYTLDSLSRNFYSKSEDLYNVSCIAAFEAMLTDGYLKMGAHLNKGRFNPDTMLLEWNPKKLDTNWISILKCGIEKKDPRAAFDSLEPKHKGYQFLKKALLNYIVENEKLNWDSISFLNVTDTLKLKEEIKQRLIQTGDYNDSLKVNDSLKLAKGIKSFQKRFNLEPDGKLGKYTKQALGLNKELTIRQMEMTLERWRWEPAKYPDKYAVVNIPSADLHVWEWYKKKKVDTLVFKSRVVVGKPENQTPLLKSKINYMLIYPYWNVPFSIAWKEILPMVKNDTNYLHKHNFEVINGRGEVVTNLGKLNWKKYNKENLPVRFRQRIGDENSLGICKFNFNSKYDVYMHDTNSKRYFKTFYRYQSHGCIRLEKYMEMARFLIRDDTLKIPYDTLNAYFIREKQEKINLRKPLPIYVKYFTAGVDSVQHLQLFLDVYKKDRQMMQMAYRK